MQRNSNSDYGIGVRDTRQSATPSIAASQVRPEGTIEVGSKDGWRAGLIQSLTGLADKVSGQMVDNEIANKYLKGAAEAGQIESEASIEQDSMTSAWEVAGYRDTMGKLSMAKADAQMATDMSWLRERSPEEFQQYLNKQRSEVMPSLTGMSERARMGMLPQMALNDRHAIMKHAGEHKKYIFETISKGYSTEVGTVMQKLDTSRDLRDNASYMTASDAAAGTIWRLHDDPRLSAAQKADLTAEMAGVLLAGQHTGVFEQLRDKPMPDGFDKNTASTILSRLPMDAQEKLGKAYKTAKQATAAMANANFRDQLTIEEAKVREGRSDWNWDQHVALMDAGEAAGIVSPGKRDEYLGLVLKNAAKFNDKLAVSTAFLSNDKGALLKAGKTDAEAADIALDVMKEQPPPQQFQQLTQAGSMGMQQAYAVAGKIANNSIAAIATPDGKFNVQHAEMWAQLTNVLDTAAKNDTPTVSTGLLSGLSDENRLRVQRMRALQSERGLTGDMAVAEVLKMEQKDSNMSREQKVALAEHNTKADMQYVAGIGDEGWFKRAWWAASGSVFEDNALKAAMAQNPAFRGKPAEATRGVYLDKYKSAVIEELNTQTIAGTNLSQESRIEAALAKVQSRSVETKYGPVIVPRGQSVGAYFGVASGVSTGTIKEAIERTIAPVSEDGRMILTAMNGKMLYQEVDRHGTPVAGRSGQLQPTQVEATVRDILGERAKKMSDTIGPGIQVKQNGVEFRYNGNNAAGVREQDMLEFRQNLIKNEGVRNVPYKDLSGKLDKQGNPIMTVGVGVSSHNKAYPKVGEGGTVSNEAIAESFRAATNEAAVTATQLQRATGLRNSESFKLYAEFAYQGRGGKFQEFAEAMRARDENSALEWLKKTRAYELSQPERRKHYEKLTVAALRG